MGKIIFLLLLVSTSLWAQEKPISSDRLPQSLQTDSLKSKSAYDPLKTPERRKKRLEALNEMFERRNVRQLTVDNLKTTLYIWKLDFNEPLDDEGNAFLHLLIKKRSKVNDIHSIVKFALKNGAKPMQPNKSGVSPYVMASKLFDEAAASLAEEK